MALVKRFRVVSTGDQLVLRHRGESDRPVSGSATFTVGDVEPVAANTGAGLLRPLIPTPVVGDVTVASGQVLADRIVHGLITVTGTGRVENCLQLGPVAAPTTAHSLINTSAATPSALGVPNVSFTTIDPQTPSAYWTGIGNKNYDAYRVKIFRCVDAFSMFSATADGLVNVKVRASLVDLLAHFAPDYANGDRTRTHNDAAQMQGNLGGPDDILFEGNSFNARHDPTVGTQPTVYSELSCLMVSPNTQTRVSYTSRKNWYRGGVYTVNAGASNPGGTVIHDGDRFEVPGAVTPGPTKSLVINSATTRQVDRCTYIGASGTPAVNAG